jgi:hypothetical protein
MAGAGGEQDFLLLAEVLAAVGFPVGKKAVARTSGTGPIGTPEALRNHQRVMVIAGDFFERGATFHFLRARLAGPNRIARAGLA